MPRTVIVGYRPKPGKVEALDALVATHFARLYAQGLVTRRLPLVMRAADGTLLEVFEWKSQAAIDTAHENRVVQAMWGEFAGACDYVPVGSLPEAAELFSGFDSAGIELSRPPFFKVYNHVQVDGRVSTSGALRPDVLEQMTAEGYGTLINLLPHDGSNALAEEAELAREQGLAYHHIPVDFKAPTYDDYAAFETAMDGVSPDSKVYVHCAANMRVSAFVSLYGRRRWGWDRARAEALLAEVWEPNEVWRAFLEGIPTTRG